MKQMVEALERIERYGNTYLYRKTEQNPYEQVCKAITAGRQAIEQAEQEQKQKEQKDGAA